MSPVSSFTHTTMCANEAINVWAGSKSGYDLTAFGLLLFEMSSELDGKRPVRLR